MIAKLYYRVSTFREAGLEAKWSKAHSRRPYLVGRQCGGKSWLVITSDMFARMEEIGVLEAFQEFTIKGTVVSTGAGK